MWEFICGRDDAFELSAGVRGFVLPHHFCDQFEIAAVWRSAAAVLDPPLIVVLSPDHYLAGRADISLPADARFSTVYGELPVARDLAVALAAEGQRAYARSDAPFSAEHGVSVHTAFIRRYFPRARILPVLVKPGTPAGSLDALASALSRLSPPGSLFVASVDSSHYNPVALSRFHDRLSAAALESMDGPRMLNAEVDSPEALYLLNAVMRGLGVRTARVFHRTDLQDHFGSPIADNTSHLYVRYGHGPDALRPVEPALTLLALPLPAKPADAPSGVERAWKWDWRDPDRTACVYPSLAALAGFGEEDRRFMGSDLYVFGASDPGGYRWTIGGTRVALVRAVIPSAADVLSGQRRAFGMAAWERTLAEERALADCLVAVIDDEGSSDDVSGDGASALVRASDAALSAGVDLALLRVPVGAPYAEYRSGRTLVCVLPGFLVRPDGRDGLRDAAAIAAVWTPGGWTAIRLDLDHRAGVPVLSDLPTAKSYDPPPVFTERE